MTAAQTLRRLLTSQTTIVAPGVADGLSAKLVEQADFKAVYASGGAIARSTGTPDIGLLTMTEVVTRLREIVTATNLPVIADADNGYGNAINVRRTMQEFIAVGVAGCHLEDQVFPKRCGHLDQKTLISAAEMAFKIEIAKQTIDALNPDFLLIARTDAIAVEGFAEAMVRAKHYLAAGADMIFVEAPTSLEQIESIAAEIKQPKLINMFHGGKTPLIPLEKLQALGFNLVIIPSDLQRAAIYAMQTTLQAIKEQGDSNAVADYLVTFKQREAIIGTAEYLALDKRFK